MATIEAAPRPVEPAPRDTRGVREMEPGEIREFLRARWWGTLAVTCEGAPYAVPVGYGHDGRAFHVATGPGRKLRALDGDGGVCLTVTEVEGPERWTSVVITGRALPVEEPFERGLALRAIHRQRAGGIPSATEMVRALRARVFRIDPREVSGRTRG